MIQEISTGQNQTDIQTNDGHSDSKTHPRPPWRGTKHKTTPSPIASLPPKKNKQTTKQTNKQQVTDLQVLRAEVVSIHVDGGKEDGLHLVVALFIGRLVCCYQHLNHAANTLSVTGSNVHNYQHLSRTTHI